MTNEVNCLVQKLCRVCGGALGNSFQSVSKFELQDPLLNCLKIDVRNDQVISDYII